MRRLALILLSLLLALSLGCGETATEDPLPYTPPEADGDSDSDGDGEPAEPLVRDYTGPIGGDRPVTAQFPGNYDVEGNHPLLILLHGLGSNAAQTHVFFGVTNRALADGYVVLAPEGTINSQSQRFWNATTECCDFEQSGIDDLGYLTGLIEEATEKYAVAPDRVFLMGISNGGFMSHRMACDRSELIHGIVSFNGTSTRSADQCNPDHPVHVFQIHATEDDLVQYDGTAFYPGAVEVAERWANWNQCASGPHQGPSVNVTSTVAGDETTIEYWTDCLDGGGVELWTMHDAEHVPFPLADYPTLIMDALDAL